MEVRSVEAIAKALNDADVKYLVVGGLAVNAHGYERFTNDVDLVIHLETKNITRALYALRDIGYQTSIPITPEAFADAENREKWRREKEMLVLKLWSDTHRRTPIDIFIYEPFHFETEWVKCIKMIVNPEISIPILCYESLIQMKQEAGREKDLLDISSLKKLDPHRP
ncbi:MAG: hypothetical protein HC845_08365 [Akkermansiaceae bacterium]|nr:hypothetical protein [Akkermansiaceae bacterium]